MGRTIAKNCDRCGKLNYVDIDAETFTCPGCGARVEVHEEDKKMVDDAMKKVITPARKESHLYEKADKKPWGVLLLCILLIGIGYGIYRYASNYKPEEPEVEEKERVNDNLTNLLSYFSNKYRGTFNGNTY